MGYGTATETVYQKHAGNDALRVQEAERQTFAGELDDRLHVVWQRLAKLSADMGSLADRAFGPPPPSPMEKNPEGGQSPNFPAFTLVHLRLETVERTVTEAEDQFQRLHQIA